MKMETLQNLNINVDDWEYYDIKNIKLLDKDEIAKIFESITEGYYSDMDVANVCITALKLLNNKNNGRN